MGACGACLARPSWFGYPGCAPCLGKKLCDLFAGLYFGLVSLLARPEANLPPTATTCFPSGVMGGGWAGAGKLVPLPDLLWC